MSSRTWPGLARFFASPLRASLSQRAPRLACPAARGARSESGQAARHDGPRPWLSCESPRVEALVQGDVEVSEEFVSEEEERLLVKDVEPTLRRLKYQFDHWDHAIHGYRETETRRWGEGNRATLARVLARAFPPGTEVMPLTHVLDLDAAGFIRPHVDSVKFCGSIIAGLSLLSASVMRFVHEQDPTIRVDVLLKPRSLYIIRGRVRYEFTHEILKDEESLFRGERVPRGRRVAVISRNVPEEEQLA
ncbi:alpha-ketoglutarate-dependent dioxygenase alkB homolog 7, mitochondrial isoform X2 [Petromyzon marinus]|uniref:Alpha-ketoglutarate-dependent dioxygenase alkB homolog 7, mitochondrial isoform X2 n=1 Tax=Petromyzon marinus TaxID=7757 RepID=A0AAJ7X5J1_PETMA|nr:alpha-ketoglutarate-dependent dioxygenase alkB homolog 7, mitochondrial isoform X2 [Petromyzon marinus]